MKGNLFFNFTKAVSVGALALGIFANLGAQEAPADRSETQGQVIVTGDGNTINLGSDISTEELLGQERFSIPAPRDRSQDQHADLFSDYCTDVVDQLSIALDIAEAEFNVHNAEVAVEILHEALENFSGNKVNQVNWPLPPLTLKAVQQSWVYVSRVLPIVDQEVKDPQINTDIKYFMLSSLIQNIEWVYYNLDTPYYFDILDDYYHHYRNSRDPYRYGHRPGHHDRREHARAHYRAYFQKIKEYASRMLGIQEYLDVYLFSTRLELISAENIVFATKQTLLNSMMRREFCHVISEMDILSATIDRYLDPDPRRRTRINERTQTDLVRRAINHLQNHLKRYSYDDFCY